MNFLFAIDPEAGEIIVSESPKGSNKINFVERIKREENRHLYQAVELLTEIAKAPNLDTVLFKAMDKVCQLLYGKHKDVK